MSVGPYVEKPLVFAVGARPLVFDIGAHLGRDTTYYLSRGCKVVAVEAHPSLAGQLVHRFNLGPRDVNRVSGSLDGHLKVVNKAITPYGLDTTFYVSKDTERETHSIHPEKVKNPCDIPYKVAGTTLPELIVEFGLPKFIKLDIEGMDVVAIRELHGWLVKRKYEAPEWLSVELDRHEPIMMLELFTHLSQMGYTGFNVVDQSVLPKGTSGKLPWEAATMEYDLEGLLGDWFEDGREGTVWGGQWYDLHCKHSRVISDAERATP